MGNSRQRDGDPAESLFDPRETLEYMLLGTPAYFERAITELKAPPGMGRRLLRKSIDHLLQNLELLSEARRDDTLPLDLIPQHDELLRRFQPLIDDINEHHGRVPSIVMDDVAKVC